MSISRRTFLGTVAAGAAAARGIALGAADGIGLQGNRRVTNPGLQLYTVRDEMTKDVEATLAKVAAIGYKEVEFAGYFDKSPQDIKAMLGRHGLTSPSTHIAYTNIGPNWSKVLDDSRVIGHQFVTIPWLDDATRKDPDVWKKVADNLNKAGEETKKAGLQLAYHNHNFEFVPMAGGKLPFDYLLEQCSADLVKIEMDLCWMFAAGQDAASYLAKHKGRFPMVHVKDLKRRPLSAAVPTGDVVPDITDVGSGLIDWTAVLGAAASSGARHYFVEHDAPKAPFDSITASLAYVQKLRF